MVSLEDFLASCPNPEVQANKDVYAEKMRASGFGNLPSLLAQDDEEMEEMHKELKTLIPPATRCRSASSSRARETPPTMLAAVVLA